MIKKKRKVSKKRKKEEMGRAQVWSIDVLLAVVIFISVILVFYVSMVSRQKPGLKELETQAQDLKTEFEKDTGLGFITEDEINQTKFNIFIDNATIDYAGLKRQLGIQGEFCIFYEDADGNLTMIRVGDKTGVISVGNPEILINGIPCGQNVTWV